MKYFNLSIIFLCALLEAIVLDYHFKFQVQTIFFAVKYLIILFLLIVGKKSSKHSSSIISWAVVISSYVPVLLLRPLDYLLPGWIYFFSIANYLFYSVLIVFSYISLGDSIGLIPEKREIRRNGAYEISRHPIYFYSFMLLTNFLACNLSSWNIFLWITMGVSLAGRAFLEEKYLRQFPDYIEYITNTKLLTGRAVLMSLPSMILLMISLNAMIFAKKSQPRTISYASDVSFYSLNPTKYDDWTSAFISNHVLARLIDDREGNPSNAICFNFKSECVSDTNKCERIRVELNCKAIVGCSGKKLTLEKIKSEFDEILSKKNWLLPNHKSCKSKNGVCVELDQVANLTERLSSIYFRFGWSDIETEAGSSELFGFGSHCTSLSRIYNNIKQDYYLESRSEELPSIRVLISPKIQSDIYSYENPIAKNQLKKLIINTPVAYYVVSHDQLDFDSLPWNSSKTLALVRDHLAGEGLIFKNNLPFNAVPFGRDPTYFKLKNNIKEKREFLLPAFISTCDVLAEKLTKMWKEEGSNSTASCADLNETVQNTVLTGKKWDGFLSPLTPGAPYRDAIHDQYFSSKSSDAWIKNNGDIKSYYLIGLGLTPLYVDHNTICGVRDFYLGLSDLHISDFRFCN